jgi:AAA family ATP:ADP antiporter
MAGVRFGFVFFIWASIFGAMVVAQFWAFATDLFNVKSGQRVFAIIAIGVSAGAWAGARAASALFNVIGPYGLMMASAAVLAMTLALSRWSAQAVPDESRSIPVENQPDTMEKWLGGFTVVARDNYLLLIGALVILLNWITATGEYVLSDWLLEITRAATEDERQVLIGAFMGDFLSWITLLGFLIQLLLVSRIILAVGISGALLIAPIVFLTGYLAIGFVPVFALLQWTLIVQKSLDYSLLNTSRNALLLPASRAAKYEAKTTIDTFFFRFGDLLSAGSILVGKQLLELTRDQFVLLNIVLATLMVLLALVIGREFSRRAASPSFNVPPQVKDTIPDAVWRSGEALNHAVPAGAFIDTDPGDVLTLSARMPDGGPLPEWLIFDARLWTFHAVPMARMEFELTIEVVAIDFDGAAVSQRFTIRMAD